MPAAFDRCVRADGRIRTITGKKFGLARGEFRRVCFDKKGVMHMGEKSKKKK